MLVSLIGLVFLTTSSTMAYTPSGNITTSETWSSATSLDTIRLTGDVYVRNNATLTIQPGAIIRGYSGTATSMRIVYIQGSGVIRAVGTANQPIIFRNVNVEFTQTTRDSLNLLQYCTFNSGWGHAYIETRNPSEPGEQSGFTADHCTFLTGSYCCIYFTSGGNPTITNCVFRTASTGIFLHGAGRAVVRNCVISDVSCGIINASIPQFRQTLTVDHVTIYNVNGTRSYTWANGFGIMCCNDSGNLTVTNSIIDGTPSHAIRNNSDDDNYPDYPYGWNVSADYNCFNNIGGENVYLATSGAHSIEGAPLYVNAAAQDFSLQTGSPCLGQASDGTNLGYTPDSAPTSVRDNRPDRSAAAWMSLTPSPCSDRMVIDISRAGTAHLAITDPHGMIVKKLTGAGKLVWDGTDTYGRVVPPGIYICQLVSGQAASCMRIIKTTR
jgi:parallel beta-helix repeat protein